MLPAWFSGKRFQLREKFSLFWGTSSRMTIFVGKKPSGVPLLNHQATNQSTIKLSQQPEEKTVIVFQSFDNIMISAIPLTISSLITSFAGFYFLPLNIITKFTIAI